MNFAALFSFLLFRLVGMRAIQHAPFTHRFTIPICFVPISLIFYFGLPGIGRFLPPLFLCSVRFVVIFRYDTKPPAGGFRGFVSYAFLYFRLFPK